MAYKSLVELVYLDCLLRAVLRGMVGALPESVVDAISSLEESVMSLIPQFIILVTLVAHSESVGDALLTFEESAESLIVTFIISVIFKSICFISFDPAEAVAFIPVSENVWNVAALRGTVALVSFQVEFY